MLITPGFKFMRVMFSAVLLFCIDSFEGYWFSPLEKKLTVAPDERRMLRLCAGVPEWPKGSDCKSDARASVVRIHPPAPFKLQVVRSEVNANFLT